MIAKVALENFSWYKLGQVIAKKRALHLLREDGNMLFQSGSPSLAWVLSQFWPVTSSKKSIKGASQDEIKALS